MTAVVHVSGHGFGHAVRAGDMARELARRGVEVVLRSNARAEAFGPLQDRVRLELAEVDLAHPKPPRSTAILDTPAPSC